jgi:hypothetical protein
MDLETLIDETRERIGETTEADFFTDAEVTRAINEALRRFSNEERWPWLFTEFSGTTTQDDADFDLPSNIAINRTFGLHIPDSGSLAGGQMLERVTPMEGFRLKVAYSDHTGVPRFYYISHTGLLADGAPPVTYTARLVPTPDEAYDVEGLYMAVPDLLSGDGDEPMLPEEYQAALPAYAAGVLFLKELQISQKASEQFALYQSILMNAVKETKQFNADETVAWGRSKPALRMPFDVLSRISPTLGA